MSVIHHGTTEVDRRVQSGRAWVLTVLLVAFLFLNYADKAVLAFAGTQIQAELGISPAQFGLVQSAFFWLFAAGAACDDPKPNPDPTPAPPEEIVVAADGTRFGIQTLANNLEIPWALAFAPDGRLFFTERPGRVRVMEGGQLRPAPNPGQAFEIPGVARVEVPRRVLTANSVKVTALRITLLDGTAAGTVINLGNAQALARYR